MCYWIWFASCCFFFFLINYLFIFACTGSSLLCMGFLWLGEQGVLSSCSVWAPHCSGFSRWDAQTLQHERPRPRHAGSTVRITDSEAHGLREAWHMRGVPQRVALPRPGAAPASPASAGKFSTTRPPGKSCCCSVENFSICIYQRCWPVVFFFGGVFALVSRWWWLHRMTLGVFPPLQSLGRIWEGSV